MIEIPLKEFEGFFNRFISMLVLIFSRHDSESVTLLDLAAMFGIVRLDFAGCQVSRLGGEVRRVDWRI